MMLFYSLALTLVLTVSAPVWGWRMLRQGRYREGLRERLGAVPARLCAFVQDRPLVWLHAVSVGEVMAATRLVAELEAALPGYAIVISTTTPTGQQIARERFGVDRAFFYPLDFGFAVRAYLDVLKPRLVILMESELWPRMLMECGRSGVAVAVVNARVSDRSLPRYRALRVLWRPLLQRVSLMLAQSGEDARRWISSGAPEDHVRSVGNLKYDVRGPEETPLTKLLRAYMPQTVKVLVCGSTHEGEEDLLLDCWQGPASADRIMILAPRHPERAIKAEQLATQRGIVTVRLSGWRLAPAVIAPGSVMLVDTVGELSALYSLATVAFIGGSMIPHGGQNPLEPAQFGVPVVMGEYFENFRGVVAGMQCAGAITIIKADELCTALGALMDGGISEEQRQGSRDFFAREAGATARTVAALLPLLKERTR